MVLPTPPLPATPTLRSCQCPPLKDGTWPPLSMDPPPKKKTHGLGHFMIMTVRPYPKAQLYVHTSRGCTQYMRCPGTRGAAGNRPLPHRGRPLVCDVQGLRALAGVINRSNPDRRS